MMFVGHFTLAAAFFLQATGRAASSPSGPAPIIDIGYAVHQATINDTGYPYYNFSNIRFGAPPTGKLRFAAPISPNVVNRTVNDGQNGGTCPQANPAWLLIAEEFLSGAPIASLANQTAPSSLNISSLPKPGPQTSEDCLFLDVIVPESIYEAPCAIASRERFIAGDRNSESDNGAAVLVWIYGGGFTTGSKTDNGDPAGILARARENNSTGVIFVAINYRLGLFGWLSGPSFLEDTSTIANAGLYDQRLALEWVKTHIHLFGGDPSRVTVIGESGGGASIEHQITAYGGKRNAPFHQAILQSPGFKPKPGKAEQEEIFQKTLHIASLIAGKNVTKSHQLRGLSFIELYFTNVVVVGTGVYGSFTYGPVLDGSFVPDLPGKLLLEGKFDHCLNIMTSYNSAEGLVFSSPFFQNNTDFVAYVQSVLPTASPSTIDYVTKILYPDLSNGSVGYGTQLNRTSLFNSEFSFTCNTWYLDVAFNNKPYAYFFSVPPGLHAIDIPYTFFNGDSTTADDGVPVNAKIAVALQRYITNFAMRGNPNQEGVPYFPVYGTNTSMQNIGFDGFGTQVRDEAANMRCAWWQKGLYY